MAAAIAGFLVASLAEYWVHRLMHHSPTIGQRHRDHHRRNDAQGVLPEFADYLKGGLLAMLLPLAFSWAIGLGWFLGCLVYALFSAYAHQLQHETPHRCIWLAMPVHYVHHKYGMWHHNFGLAVDWWDRLFGTYKPVEWLDATEQEQSPQGWLALRWW